MRGDMSLIEIILRLVVLLLLIIYLGQKQWVRIRTELQRCEEYEPFNWTGDSIDSANPASRIMPVRPNNLASRPVRSRNIRYHNRLRASIRQIIRQYAYFLHLKGR
jgi:hypothetical protein